ncbi:MAG: DUF2840 domain-containing protein [Bdellovibrionales bacterium]|nr:DUF2840 domain-containing protein [Bdellovibrionales bacterium]
MKPDLKPELKTVFTEEFHNQLPILRLLYGNGDKLPHVECGGGIIKQDYVFDPGDRFIVEEYLRQNDHVEQWGLRVLKAGDEGERLSRVRNVNPGAHVLLDATGQRDVLKTIEWLSIITEHTDPANISDEVYYLAEVRLKSKIALKNDIHLYRVK